MTGRAGFVATGAVVAIVLALATVAPTASAQEPDPEQEEAQVVTLTLRRQTPWNTPKQPVMAMELAVTNGLDADLRDLSVEVTVFDQLNTRSEFEASLTRDEGAPLAMPRPFVELESQNVLPPGAVSTIALRQDVASLVNESDEARVYPVKVELFAGGRSQAVLRTPLIFLPEEVEVPVDLVWTFVLGYPIAYSPDGTFQGRELERQLAVEGPLSGEIEALRGMLAGRGAEAVDVAISPTLLENLVRMRDGYRIRNSDGFTTVPPGEGGAADAARALEGLRSIATARRAEVSAMPYGMPDLTQLQRSGLASDIPPQLAEGRARLREVLDLDTPDLAPRAATASDPAPAVFRPPSTSLDPRVLETLRSLKIRTLLVNAGAVQQPRELNDFAPPALVSLAAGNGRLDTIAPDERLDAYLDPTTAQRDPRLTAQIVLGDLAAVWLEAPDEPRTVALLIGPERDMPAAFFESITELIPKAPWLRPVKAGVLSERADAPVERDYSVSRVGPIDGRYLEQIRAVHDRIDAWTSALADDTDRAMERRRLTRQLFLTQGSSMVDARFGESWLRAIEAELRGHFSEIRADTQQVVTLTSKGGRLPVRVSNGSQHAVGVSVTIESGGRLRFPGGNAREVTLAPGETQVLIFDADAQATGTFPVTVAIRAPDGYTMSETTISVRSTAYNRIALAITIAAMAVLLVVWLRRSRGRRRSERSTT